MIKAILMDFNGVIIDDEPIQMRIYQELLAADSIALTDEDYMSSLGMDDRTFVRAAYERAGKTIEAGKVLELTTEKAQRWRDIIAKEMPLFPGVENFIRKCANEFHLGIVSMSRRADVEHVLDVTKLDRFFSIIVGAEDVTNCKPDPQCYRDGFRLLDAARTAGTHLPMIHEECLAIEDSPPGVQAARAAGLPVLGVMNTVGEDELRAAGAIWVADNLDDWMPESIRQVFARKVRYA